MNLIGCCDDASNGDFFDRVHADARDVRARIVSLGGAAVDDVSSSPMQVHLFPRSFAFGVSTQGDGTDVLMYGTDAHGATVRARVRGFYPSFCVRARGASAARIDAFVRHLDGVLSLCGLKAARDDPFRKSNAAAAADGRSTHAVHRYLTVDAIAVKTVGADRGYQGNRAERFVRIEVYAPRLVRLARTILEFASTSDIGVAHEYGDARRFIVLLFDELQRARERNAATPATDLKGRVRNAKTKAARFERAAARCHKLADDAADPSPWNDLAVDVVYHDDDANDALSSTASFASSSSDRYFWLDHEPACTFVADLDGATSFAEFVRALLLVGESNEVFDGELDFINQYLVAARFKAEECVVYTGSTSGVLRSAGLSTIDFTCSWRELERADDRFQNLIAPQVVLSIDCEMEMGPRGAFPRPESERVLQICCVIADPVADRTCAHVVRRAFVLGSVELPADAGWSGDEVLAFASECNMLLAFGAFLCTLQPDALTGWNIEAFDMDYLFRRAATLDCAARFAQLGRSRAPASIRDRVFQSSAHSTQQYREVLIDGLWVWDLLLTFRRTYKLRSYKLEAVANRFLHDRKEDVSYSEINRLQQSAAGRFRLMRYCTKDALLPLQLVTKLALLFEYIELAHMTGVAVDPLCRRGQQVRVKSVLARFAAHRDTPYLFYSISDAERRLAIGTTYEGAYVHPPHMGYHREPIAVLDFASLYPSIIVTWNKCGLSLIPGRQLAERMARFGLTDADLWRPPETFDAVDGDVDDQPVFVRRRHTVGLLPSATQYLIDERARVKRQKRDAERANDELMATVFDKRQQAIKVITNSVYGYCGAGFCREIAASVTAYGRLLIRETERVLEARFRRSAGYPFDVRTVYGDSVTGDTPLVVRDWERGPVRTVTFDDLWAELAVNDVDDGEKQVISRDALPLVYSDLGFTKIVRVVRHRVAKPIVRVVTPSGVVDVTTDHSLVRADGRTEVRPCDVRVGDELLHAAPLDERLFACNCALLLVDRAHIDWYAVAFNSAHQCTHCAICNSAGERRVPAAVLNAKLPLVRRFVEHVLGKWPATWWSHVMHGKELAAGLLILAHRLGYDDLSVAEHAKGDNYFVLQRFAAVAARRSVSTPPRELSNADDDDVADRFVYDIETRSHHFHVAPGSLVVHNTDSVFMKLSDDVTVQRSAEFGKEMAEHITEHFAERFERRPDNIIRLEFEKTFVGWLSYARKKYAGWRWTPDKLTGAMVRDAEPDASGLETERRDACVLVARGVRAVLRMVLDRAPLDDIRRYIRRTMIEPVERGTADWSQLILSKQYRSPIDEYTASGRPAPIHIQLVARLDRRFGTGSPGTYQPGQRVQYIIVEPTRPGQKLVECAEDPDYAWRERLPLNRAHYIEHGVAATMARILEPLLCAGAPPAPSDAAHRRTIQRAFDDFIRGDRSAVATAATTSISVKRRRLGGPLAAFATTSVARQVKRCELCSVPCDGSAICGNHSADERRVHRERVDRNDMQLVERRAELWRTCRACVQRIDLDAEPERAAELPPTPDIESLEVATPCKNSSCDVYWQRRLNDKLMQK